MVDIRMIRENPEEVRTRIATKGVDVPIEEILGQDEQRRRLITEVERIKAERNEGSKLVGRTKDADERNRLIADMKSLGDRIAELDAQVRDVDAELHDLMLGIPNLPDPDVPIGPDASANVVASEGGEKRDFVFTPRPHWELAEELGIIDFERGVKVAGSRGYVLRGDGAKLQRALIQWMLEVHTTRHGYSEVDPPYQVLGEMLVGTGNLPKFADTLFHDAEEDKWLIPTAEVPVTNLYRDEILNAEQLPIYHVAATPCFRREQISAGRDVRGIKRVYQFEKVEMVKFAHPDHSEDELTRLIDEALYIVNQLRLPYRVLDLSTGDMTFGSAHTFDIETWAPGSDEWLEISSCSLFRDFQARRANLRFRPEGGGKPQFLHTLNGSGLALPRVIIAIIENYQREDGTIEIPDVIRPWFGGRDTIGKQPPIGPSCHAADA
ncbi:MAG TPA: serine--tRNA ligase [Thermomicrobiales bacterium]|nr:serine--tRNA ligase [Thermomicrobiales bacterium]